MTTRYYSFKEMYIFLKKLEQRGLSLDRCFLIATEKQITIEEFLTTLERFHLCSKYFIKEYFNKYYQKDKIYFFEDLLSFIQANECFDRETSVECIRILFSKFLEKAFFIEKKEQCVFNLLEYAKSLNLDYPTCFEEQFMQISPLLYVTIEDVYYIPAYLVNYSLFIECEEENYMYEEHEEIAYSLNKRDELKTLLEDLEGICDDVEKDLILNLKKSLCIKD